jgi:hypothetical protein
VFVEASNKDAVLFTTYKDFFHTIPYQFKSQPDVIVIALKHPNSISIISKLEWFLLCALHVTS